MSAATAPAESGVSLVIELRASSLFSSLTIEELLPLAATAERVAYPSGSDVFEQGDESTHLYVVTAGRVEVVRDGRTLATLSQGEHFGEMGLLDGSRRAATVRVLSDAALVCIARQDFDELMELYPGLALNVARVLSARIRGATALRVRPATPAAAKDDAGRPGAAVDPGEGPLETAADNDDATGGRG